MAKGLLFYDIEVFAQNSLVVFKTEDDAVVAKWWESEPDRASKIRALVESNTLVGYNNYHYDDLILTYMMQSRSAAEIKDLNDKIIAGTDPGVYPDKAIDSLDTMQQIDVGNPSLKMIEGNLGMSIEESSVPFDIPDPLTDDQKADTEFYCEHDVSATIRVYQLRKKSYFDVKEGLLSMMEEPEKGRRWNTTTISSNILLGDKRLIEWAGLHVPDELWRQVRNIPEAAWKMWEGLNITNIRDKGNFVETEAFGCEITFGVGGLHGAPKEPEVFEHVMDADVASMYPSIIVHPKIDALGESTAVYDGMRKERVSIKKTDPIRAGALKIVLNSVYGNFKNRFSALYNPFASATVTIYGQIAAIQLCNLLDDAGYRITNINTDGVMFLANDHATRDFASIKAEWEAEFGLGLDVDQFDKMIQRDVNNYISVTNGKITAKGGDVNHYAASLPFKNDNCRIVQIALVDYLAKGIPVKDTFEAHMDDPSVWQYVLRAGSTYRYVKDDSGNIMNKVNRVFAAREDVPGTVLLKKWKRDGTSSKFADAPERMFLWNGELSDCPDLRTFIDTDHYKALVEKKITAWKTPKKKPAKRKAKDTAKTEQTEAPVRIVAVDPLEAIAKKFRGAKKKKTGVSWTAYCPIHEKEGKHNPSLLIRTKDHGKTIYLKCTSQGCKEAEIMKAGGVTYADLGRAAAVNPDKWKIDYLKYRGDQDHCEYEFGAAYDYTEATGEYVKTKIRIYKKGTKEKDMRTIRKAKDGSEYYEGAGDGHPDPVMYNLPKVLKTIEDGYPVYYVEGEKDVDTLTELGLSATTAGGACDWKPEDAVYFTGARVTILADNDEAGQNSAKTIQEDMRKYAFATRIFTPSHQPKGDITDYLKGDNPEGNWESIKAQLANKDHDWEYADWTYLENGSRKINDGALAGLIGSTRNFFIVRRPGDSKKSYYEYDGTCYKQKPMDDLKAVVQRYIPLRSGLLTAAKVRNVYDLTTNLRHHDITYDQLDRDENIIIVKNGVIDLTETDSEGRFKLLPHSPRYKSTTCLQTVYDPEADCKVFKQYMRDLCTSAEGIVDKDKMKSVQEYCGLIVSNIQVMKTKKSLWLYSPQGNTGKSQLLKVLTEIVGVDKQCNINLSEMNRDRNKFSMMAIVGKRMIQIPDMSSMVVENSTVFKQLLGNDRVTIEGKGRDVFDYQFRGGLIVASNGLPTFRDDKGDHIPERMMIVSCEHHIEEADRDTEIFDKMRKELPGILNWLLEGLTRYLANGHLTESESSIRARKSYREKSDTVIRFINRHYVITKDPNDRVKAAELEEAYKTWYAAVFPEDQSQFQIRQQNIKSRLASNGVLKKQARIGNFNGSAYTGIRKMTEAELDALDPDDLD